MRFIHRLRRFHRLILPSVICNLAPAFASPLLFDSLCLRPSSLVCGSIVPFPEDSVGNHDCALHRFHVMHAQASAPPAIASAQAASVPSSRSSGGRSSVLPMKDLREGPTTIGRPSDLSSASRLRISNSLHGLAEADSRVHHDLLLRNARLPRPLDAGRKVAAYLGHHVTVERSSLHGSRCTLDMHDYTRNSGLGNHPGQLRVEPKTRDVIHQRRPFFQANPGNLRLGRVNRDRAT